MSSKQKNVLIVVPSKRDGECSTGIDGLSSIKNIHHNKSKSQVDACGETIWVVITLVSITTVRITTWLQVRIWSSSSTITVVVLITIFVPYVGLVARRKSGMWDRSASKWRYVPGN